MHALQRVTTEYVDSEDRIRLSGEFPNGDTVVLWLTQRLMNRLAPHLLAWLVPEAQPQASPIASSGRSSAQAVHHDVVQGFAQQAALAQLTPAPPVRASSPQASWRVESVDITRGEDAVTLTFKGEGDARATLTFAAQPLRQWLGIIFEQYLRAEWPTAIWPEWMEAARSQKTGDAATLH